MVQAKLAKLRRELLEPGTGASGGGGKGEGEAQSAALVAHSLVLREGSLCHARFTALDNISSCLQGLMSTRLEMPEWVL